MGTLMGEAVGSVVGNPRKALLLLFTGANPVFDAQQVAEAAEHALGGSASALLSSFQRRLSATSDAVNDYHVLEVQYNPSSLSIQANAESVPVRYLQQNLDSGVPTQLQRPPSVVLSVELTFDAVNLADSFLWERFASGVSAQSAANIASAGQAGKGKTWSVKAQTNGLLAALMRDSTRTVIFKWADMTFAGEATETQARYTMFSPSGRPVRSTVWLNITQQVKDAADIKYWDKAFGKAVALPSSKGKNGGLGDLIHIGF